MPQIPNRRKRFKAALTHLGSTQAAFCREHQISPNHLHRILIGERLSPRIEGAIAEAIAAGEDLANAATVSAA